MTKNFILLFIFISNFLLAQEIPFQIQKSAIFEDDYKDSKLVLAEKYKENQMLIVRSFQSSVSVSRGLYIGKYDQLLNKISDFKLDIEHPLSEKYSSVIGVYLKDSKVTVVEVFYDLRSKNFICQAIVIDENYQIIKKELFRLDKDEVKGFGIQKIFYEGYDIDAMNEEAGNFKEEDASNEFLSRKTSKGSFPSSSRSQILMKINKQKSFFTIGLAYQNGKKSYVKLFLFDSALEKKLEKEVEGEQNEVVFQNLELDNDLGVIYLTEKRYSEDLKRKDKGGKYSYKIRKITTSDDIALDIDVKNHYVSSLRTFNHDGKLFSIGFYSDEDDFKYGGISYFEMDLNKFELIKSNYNLFDEQFILDKYGKLKDKEYKNISLKQIFFNDKKELFINAEEVYLFKSYNNSTIGGASSEIFYSYDDIVTIKLDSNGKLLYARNINKSQSSRDQDEVAYISYSSFLLDNKNVFFINAKDKVKKLSNDRIEFGQAGKNRSDLNVIVIKENGDFEFKEILDNDVNEVPFMVSKGILIDKSVVFFGRRGKKKQFLKVTLE